ncbi:EAL domain-containing protein [Massilia sp. PWRC2]|uniref:response regulator n=1 Tax=Massilia sp. PWRC2 TaxID=2804626 RepID=UPI003CF74600
MRAAQQQVAIESKAAAALPAACEPLAQADLCLRYEPVVGLHSGALDSLEVRVGWQHPQLGLLSAAQCAAQARAGRLPLPPPAWMLQQLCRDLQAWRRQAHPTLRVALDLLPDEFCDPLFGPALIEMLVCFDLPADALTLEMNEAALAHAGSQCAARLAQLRSLGLSLTLDEFGSGPASLRNLRCDAFDAVKIAADVVSAAAADGMDGALWSAVIAMAHQLGMKVAAEGVQTAAQCAFLSHPVRHHQCDQLQGPVFSGPLCVAELNLLLASGRTLAPQFLHTRTRARRLMLVDDEPNILAALQRLLRRDQYQIVLANSGAEGLAMLAANSVDVIVSDQRMPGMLGADFLRKARAICPDSIRIMLSGYTELQSVTDAVNEGAIFKFLTKPWDDEQFRGHIAEAFRIKEIADDNQRLHFEVRSANHELAAANRKLEQLLREKQEQISLDEITLNVARELMQHLPLPIIGLDDRGMIAFLNRSAEQLLSTAGALLGKGAALVLPYLLADGALAGAASSHRTDIAGTAYRVLHYRMGQCSASRGSLLALISDNGTP